LRNNLPMKKTRFQIALKKRGLRLSDLARELCVHRSQVTRWARGVVPASRVVAVSEISGIPRHELRRDLYPLER
jgi:transcriptional regulator with XRE-family HTH domain